MSQVFVLVGRTTADVELRFTNGGTAVATFTVACDRYNAKKLKEEGKQGTDFFKCVSFGKQGEYLANNLKKGKLVEVHGEINIDQVKEGDTTKYFTKVITQKANVLEYEKTQSGSGVSSDFGDFQTTEDDDDIPF